MWINTVLKCHGVNAAASNYDEEDVGAFYMGSEKFYREDHTFFKAIIEDFDVKIGPRKKSEGRHIVAHGLGLEWNEQRERLSEFIMTNNNNEIDHIIVNRKFCLTDVAVLPKFYTESDHRLLQATFHFLRKGEKAAKYKERNPKTTANCDLFTSLPTFGKMAFPKTLTRNTKGSFNILMLALVQSSESSKATKRRVSRNTRADTPAWNRTSCRQPRTNVRNCKTMQTGYKTRF
ncbi:unnamed protein product [Angiostrongylus costaricensis]|uniref:Reverse transcriptase domain-containing protein n=1 Tax=Angiostrongylus costaricensis TaxID=334426 RepID=A0A0R3PK17_ANGCS|nr:unnamed protein product [Angiostrongylus costaricensis]